LYLYRILTNLTMLFISKFYLSNVLNKLVFVFKILNNLETLFFFSNFYLHKILTNLTIIFISKFYLSNIVNNLTFLFKIFK